MKKWCPKCKKYINDPGTTDISKYAKFWRDNLCLICGSLLETKDEIGLYSGKDSQKNYNTSYFESRCNEFINGREILKDKLTYEDKEILKYIAENKRVDLVNKLIKNVDFIGYRDANRKDTDKVVPIIIELLLQIGESASDLLTEYCGYGEVVFSHICKYDHPLVIKSIVKYIVNTDEKYLNNLQIFNFFKGLSDTGDIIPLIESLKRYKLMHFPWSWLFRKSNIKIEGLQGCIIDSLKRITKHNFNNTEQWLKWWGG